MKKTTQSIIGLTAKPTIMNKEIYYQYFFLIIFLLIFTFLFWSLTTNAQTTAIPDSNFEQALIDLGYDSGTLDGSVLTANISSVTYLAVADMNISDLTGIEDFAALDTLYCPLNQLTSLDVSQNTALTTLWCYVNQLTSLDVSNNAALTTLYCYYNQLTSLDVSNNSALTYLECSLNQLTSLNISNNTALTFLNCYYNQLTSLNVSNNTALTTLYCYNNQLTSLDVSNNTALTTLHCYYNQLTSLDVSNNVALTELWCYDNQLTCLNVKNGNNQMIGIGQFRMLNNPNLTCIEVDDVNLTTTWFYVDPQASFSEACNNSCSSTSIGITENTSAFNIYPNPATNYFVVEAGYPVKATLYNAHGKVLLEKEIPSTYTIKTSNLANGIYIIKVTTDEGLVYVKRVIKE